MTQQHDANTNTIETASRSRRALVLFIALVIAVLAIDLVSKSLAFKHVADVPVDVSEYEPGQPSIIPPHDAKPVVPSVLSLKLVLNEGAVFGIGRGKRWLFIAMSIAALFVIGTIFWRSPARATLLHIALALLLAGALGNMYDRLVFGVVRDLFWLFPGVKLPFGWSWPGGNDELYPWVFNIADAALCAGVGLILLDMLFHRRPDTESS